MEEIHERVYPLKPIHCSQSTNKLPATVVVISGLAPLLSQVPIQGWPTCVSELDHKIYGLNKISERGRLEADRGLVTRFSRRGAYGKPPKNGFLRAESQPFR